MIWALIKPETIVFCYDELCNFIVNEEFSVCDKIKIDCFSALSNELYSNSKKISKQQINLQNILRKQLLFEYADFCEIWFMKAISNISDIEAYQLLNQIKWKFRNMNWDCNIHLSVKCNNIQSVYHYTYLHIPDPNEQEIFRETNIIKNFICVQ
ncbi:MAG: hypothetical protein LBS55_07400 [Prevotellaceae bacterium]|jgi:hypothetical protein|nr:hypothetical protein [Prevotellaceae bacterium]